MLSDRDANRGNCSNNRIGDLNTSKAKLRGAKHQGEKTKTKLFICLYCHVAKLLLSEMFTAYITRERKLHVNRWIIKNQYGEASK